MEWLLWSPWDFVLCFCGLLDGAQRSNRIPVCLILLINKNVPLVNSVQWIGHFRVPNSDFQNEVMLAYVVNGIFGLAAREMDREPKQWKTGEGKGKEGNLTFLSHPFPALLLAPFFTRSLTLATCSLLRNRTETLATQAKIKCKTFMVKMSFICVRIKTIIFKSMAFHLASVWNRGLRQLGNGL